MKSKLKISAGVVLFLISAVACALAQTPGAFGGPQGFNPATGLPVGAQQPQIDPTTGLPVAQAVPDWKDSNWKDPDITLTNVFFDNIPLSEIGRLLSEQFKQQFDVLLPGNTSGATYMNGQMVPASWQTDWRSESVILRLKNVTASEIFAAMNLLFENNRTPLRWELKVNGHRQIALLRVLAEPMPQPNAFGPTGVPEMQRRVYFVGELIGDEKDGGMTMEQIIKTITDVWKMSDTLNGDIQFHKEAQLLVVTGTADQVNFMEQTLAALKQRTEWDRFKSASKSGDAKPKPEEMKSAPLRK